MKRVRDPIHCYRRIQEVDGTISDILKTLVEVEINPVELCNRKCIFCPRGNSQVYGNRRLFMSEKTAHSIGAGLSEIGFGKDDSRYHISISGFGEPLLHPKIVLIIEILKEYLEGSKAIIELNCNGDFLDEAKTVELISAGLGKILVNLYDGVHQIAKFERMFDNLGVTEYILRHHYLGAEDDYGLTLNNRSGMVSVVGQLKSALASPCYYPFYRMMIDWNGALLLCGNDWGRRAGITGNVNDKSIRSLWLSHCMKNYRLKLMKRNRGLMPCRECDVNGTLHGQSSFRKFREFYKKKD